MVFSDDGLQIVHRTKPVKVGGDLKLYCTSEGGDPPPTLSWRKAQVPWSAVGQDVDSLSGRVTSTVVISGLTQEDQVTSSQSEAFTVTNQMTVSLYYTGGCSDMYSRKQCPHPASNCHSTA